MLGGAPVVVQFPNSRVISHIVSILEECNVAWKDVNEHNAALDSLNKAEPTVMMINNLRKEFEKEMADKVQAEAADAVVPKSHPKKKDVVQ